MVVTAKCSHCNLVLVAGSNSGTSHLKRHLLRCPKRPEGLQIGDGVDDEEDGDAFVFDMNVLKNIFCSILWKATTLCQLLMKKGLGACYIVQPLNLFRLVEPR